jgi:polar amino acid transport system substrate-binding protein
MCPKTPWGAGVIDAVDAVLRVERPGPAYQAIVEKWSSAHDARQIRAAWQGALKNPP